MENLLRFLAFAQIRIGVAEHVAADILSEKDLGIVIPTIGRCTPDPSSRGNCEVPPSLEDALACGQTNFALESGISRIRLPVAAWMAL